MIAKTTASGLQKMRAAVFMRVQKTDEIPRGCAMYDGDRLGGETHAEFAAAADTGKRKDHHGQRKPDH